MYLFTKDAKTGHQDHNQRVYSIIQAGQLGLTKTLEDFPPPFLLNTLHLLDGCYFLIRSFDLREVLIEKQLMC